MTRSQIERFLAILARELGVPARAYVTGAAAAALWGHVRPSLDIDLGIEIPLRGRANRANRTNQANLANQANRDWSVVEAAVARTTALTGIPASAAADIDRWGMITLLDYRRSSRLYKKIASLEVRLLDPRTWSIGKLTRFLDPDIRDVSQILRRRRVGPLSAARLWGRALRASPASTAQFQFRQHVETFLEHEGKRIWGKAFDLAAAAAAFRRAAGIPPTADSRPKRRAD